MYTRLFDGSVKSKNAIRTPIARSQKATRRMGLSNERALRGQMDNAQDGGLKLPDRSPVAVQPRSGREAAPAYEDVSMNRSEILPQLSGVRITR